MRKIALISVLIFFLGFFVWQGICLPKDLVGEEKLFFVERSQGFFQIAENLEKGGLIKNKYFFELYVFLKGKQRKLQAGKYSLDSSMDIAQIAKRIISGKTLKIKVTIPEGFNLKEIQERLIENGVLKEASLDKLNTANFKAEFNFLESVPDQASLEGFLFPQTYFFDPDMGGSGVAKSFLKNFGQNLNQDLRDEIQSQGKTIFEIVIMASLLEKEVESIQDKKLVSGILWKRLESGIPLQVDATIIYITGKKTIKISKEEIQIDSLYNTYKYRGLPIGPICNPGLESILAALYPKDSQYWYYLSIPEGQTIFSQTLKEHNIAKAKYLK